MTRKEACDPGTQSPPKPCCPVCGAGLYEIKCKVVCSRCRTMISNCNGD